MALLHCAIFSATGLAMLLRMKKLEVCACALVKTAVKLRDKLLEGDTLCNDVVNCCNPLQKVEPSSTSCNASRNRKIARQPMLHCAILQQLVWQWHCETSCLENCIV